MPLHIYCIVPTGLRPDALAGVDRAAVQAASAGDVDFWYSEHAAAPPATAETIIAHNAVIQAAMSDDVTPVPVRFGQRFAALEQARSRLTADAPHWRAELDRLAGCAEYAVRIVANVTAEPERVVHSGGTGTGSGSDYMAALQRRHAASEQRRVAADAIADELKRGLGDRIVAGKTHYLEDGGLISCAFLVARERAADYHAVLARLSRSRPDLRFLFTGPWPPYSFVA